MFGWLLSAAGEAATEEPWGGVAVRDLLAGPLGERDCRSSCSGSGVGDRLKRTPELLERTCKRSRIVWMICLGRFMMDSHKTARGTPRARENTEEQS